MDAQFSCRLTKASNRASSFAPRELKADMSAARTIGKVVQNMFVLTEFVIEFAMVWHFLASVWQAGDNFLYRECAIL